jgi:hypothetical protein
VLDRVAIDGNAGVTDLGHLAEKPIRGGREIQPLDGMTGRHDLADGRVGELEDVVNQLFLDLLEGPLGGTLAD